jgi:hypothetical protein
MIEVRAELLQAIVNYLVRQPWADVNGLIIELQKLKLKAVDPPNREEY